jgi:hypothetical protein
MIIKYEKYIKEYFTSTNTWNDPEVSEEEKPGDEFSKSVIRYLEDFLKTHKDIEKWPDENEFDRDYTGNGISTYTFTIKDNTQGISNDIDPYGEERWGEGAEEFTISFASDEYYVSIYIDGDNEDIRVSKNLIDRIANLLDTPDENMLKRKEKEKDIKQKEFLSKAKNLLK